MYISETIIIITITIIIIIIIIIYIYIRIAYISVVLQEQQFLNSTGVVNYLCWTSPQRFWCIASPTTICRLVPIPKRTPLPTLAQRMTNFWGSNDVVLGASQGIAREDFPRKIKAFMSHMKVKDSIGQGQVKNPRFIALYNGSWIERPALWWQSHITPRGCCWHCSTESWNPSFPSGTPRRREQVLAQAAHRQGSTSRHPRRSCWPAAAWESHGIHWNFFSWYL